MKKMIFLNVGWMKNYQGNKNDRIMGGGSFVQEHGYGHEIFNFLAYNGYLYGFVETKQKNRERQSIRIERLEANKKDDHIDNILAI